MLMIIVNNTSEWINPDMVLGVYPRLALSVQNKVTLPSTSEATADGFLVQDVYTLQVRVSMKLQHDAWLTAEETEDEDVQRFGRVVYKATHFGNTDFAKNTKMLESQHYHDLSDEKKVKVSKNIMRVTRILAELEMKQRHAIAAPTLQHSVPGEGGAITLPDATMQQFAQQITLQHDERVEELHNSLHLAEKNLGLLLNKNSSKPRRLYGPCNLEQLINSIGQTDVGFTHSELAAFTNDACDASINWVDVKRD